MELTDKINYDRKETIIVIQESLVNNSVFNTMGEKSINQKIPS